MIPYKSFEEFCEACDGRIFSYLIYRRVYTPYEREQKFSDETYYEDDVHHGVIVEVAHLSDGDYLIGFNRAEEGSLIEYVKLSEIRLFAIDNEEEAVEEVDYEDH